MVFSKNCFHVFQNNRPERGVPKGSRNNQPNESRGTAFNNSNKVGLLFSFVLKSIRNYFFQIHFSNTVFPRIVVATTILFLGLRCDNYSRETTIQGRKLLFSRQSLSHLLWSTEASEVLELTHNHTLIPLPL